MLKIAVLDDEAIFYERVSRRLYLIYEKMHLAVDVDCYRSGRELMYEVDDGKYYDIYLLDIDLPDMSGIDLGRELRERSPYCYIIFLTAYPQYAIEGYSARAYQYILKDQWEQKLETTLSNIQKEINAQTEPSYRITVGPKLEKVPVKDMGFDRSVFIVLLLICYYIIYRILMNSYLIEYLYDNMLYRWIMCIYSFLGIICFCRVYRFEYTEHLIQYWMFYLVCAFAMCGIFIIYFVRIKNEEENRMLTMRNDLLESNYQSLQKAYDENRMMYHDFKNHMLVMKQLIQEEKNKEALEYISAYTHGTLSISQRVVSGCEIIDIIVNCKIAEALEKNIDLKYEVEFIGEINA